MNPRCDTNPGAESAAWEEIGPQLDDALAALPAQYRHPLVCRYMMGMDRKSVAEELGLSESATKKRLQRGLTRLRERLAKCGVLVGLALLMDHLDANAMEQVPAGLSMRYADSLLRGSSATTAGAMEITNHIAQGALKMMFWTKAKYVVGAGCMICVSALFAAEAKLPQTPPPRADTSVETIVDGWNETVKRDDRLPSEQTAKKSAEQNDTMQATCLQIARQFMKHFVAGNTKACATLLTKDATWEGKGPLLKHLYPPKTVEGREKLRKELKRLTGCTSWRWAERPPFLRNKGLERVLNGQEGDICLCLYTPGAVDRMVKSEPRTLGFFYLFRKEGGAMKLAFGTDSMKIPTDAVRQEKQSAEKKGSIPGKKPQPSEVF